MHSVEFAYKQRVSPAPGVFMMSKDSYVVRLYSDAHRSCRLYEQRFDKDYTSGSVRWRVSARPITPSCPLTGFSFFCKDQLNFNLILDVPPVKQGYVGIGRLPSNGIGRNTHTL